MKNLIFLIGILFVASCTPIKLPTERTSFVVDRIVVIDTNTKMCYYYMVPDNNKDLNSNPTWICDSINAYKKDQKVFFGGQLHP